MRVASQLPVCCSNPSALWPFASSLANVHLYSCSLDSALISPEAFIQAGISLPANIQHAAAKRQTEFLAGRLCARSALLRHGQPPCAPDRDAEGAPLWPAELCGSITHSGNLAAAVVATRSQWRGIGLDAELPLSASRAERLAEKILSPAEMQRLASLPPEQRAARISLTFCSKEALFKALYPLVRQGFYFQDAELLECQPDGRLQLRLLRDLGSGWPAGSQLDGYHAELGRHLLSLVSIPA